MKKRNLAICIVGMAFCYILTISDVTTYAAENTDDSIQTETNYWNGNESEKTFSENTEKEMHCSPEKKSELSVP